MKEQALDVLRQEFPSRVSQPRRRGRRVPSADAARSCARSSTSSSCGLRQRLEERKIELELTEKATRLSGRAGLRSVVRCASAQTTDTAGTGDRARAQDPRRRGARRFEGGGRRGAARTGVRGEDAGVQGRRRVSSNVVSRRSVGRRSYLVILKRALRESKDLARFPRVQDTQQGITNSEMVARPKRPRSGTLIRNLSHKWCGRGLRKSCVG